MQQSGYLVSTSMSQHGAGGLCTSAPVLNRNDRRAISSSAAYRCWCTVSPSPEVGPGVALAPPLRQGIHRDVRIEFHRLP